MYKQLTSEQRVQIFALLERKCPRKEIECIVATSQTKHSREVKRNRIHSGKAHWVKSACKGYGTSQQFRLQCATVFYLHPKYTVYLFSLIHNNGKDRDCAKMLV